MFVRATYYREKKTVHYFDENGEETLYIGGSFAWRTNNPGNMAKPGKRVVSTSIGYAQRTSNPNDGKDVKVKGFSTLVDIGATYGVLYYPQENMHWSDTGH